MNFKLKTAAIAVLAASLVASFAYASSDKDPTAQGKKHVATKKKETCDACDQVKALRQELQTQIDSLKTDLAEKDAQLKKAQQAAADAQAAADKAQAAASSQSQAVTDNSAAVTTLQNTVTDMKSANASAVASLSDDAAAIKKSISSPSTLHYKSITLTPGGFVAAETVYRTKATGGDIPTAFSAIPYEHADAYTLSEFFGSARQSRITLQADGKLPWGTLRGYYEGDFLGTGISSNNNQSNSYVLRQRILYAQAETNSHWTFAGGQLWSLATEQKKGITSAPGDVATPQTIDPNYVTGFVWTRQYGFRVVKNFSKGAVGVSIENPQLVYTASLAGNTPYAVIGSAGANGGNYNAAISGCSPSTSIVNYTDQVTLNSGGYYVHVPVPVYKTVNGCANIANLSFNQAPDVVLKAALDPGFGHFEIFAIAGFAHQTIYPGETTDRNLYGGLTDVLATQKATIAAGTATTVLAAPALTTAGFHTNSIILGGVGGSLRIPLAQNKLSIGAKGLYGPGMGRYGNSTLADITSDATGAFAPVHNLSGLLTVEVNPNPRLSLYLNYGGDYAGRTDFATPTATTLGAPSSCWIVSATGNPGANPALDGCMTAATMLANGSPLAVQNSAYGASWKSPSPAAVGYGSRLLNNSSCLVSTNPGYNGGASTGYAPGGSCGAQTRSVQEVTGGYWYDIYKGDRGRLRQGIQYGYAVREGWSGASGIGAKGIDNMVWTTFRYYLP